MSKDDEEKNARYRPCVGMTIFNAEGFVLVGERLDNPGAWQMPQGGIDEGEDPETAVFREMEEEIGTRAARIVTVIEDWIYYDIPPRTAKRLWGGKYKGQRQKWIALAFTGTDDDINLEAHSHPEFGRWKWVPLEDLLDYVVPFKRDVYSRVIEAFTDVPQMLKESEKEQA
ncbi:MAG: RNA pyrophosphohydrolase [Alphaproteobacteria bacterium]|nr:RNA pyrophosphohydrolase [Alphaproteobacteria bacterium]